MKQLIRIITSVLLLTFSLAGFAETGCVNWNKQVFSQLDYGFYWFKFNELGQDSVVKATNKKISTAFYDPSKPTLIYFHGWEPGSTVDEKREDFCYIDPESNKVVTDTLKFWKKAGWNVAIFYWNQFSDDKPFIAQSKVYTGEYMRWKSLGEDNKASFVKGGTHGLSIPEAALQEFLGVMHGYHGSELRIVGHSLGGQVAIQFTHALVTQIKEGVISNAALLPKRLTLLDPVFSPLPVTYLHLENTAAKNYEDMVDILHHDPNLAVDEMTTSPLSDVTAPSTADLENRVAFEKILPKGIDKEYYIKQYGPVKGGPAYDFALHRAARFIYFSSLKYLPDIHYPDGGAPPAASTSNERTRQMMNDNYDRTKIVGEFDVSVSRR